MQTIEEPSDETLLASAIALRLPSPPYPKRKPLSAPNAFRRQCVVMRLKGVRPRQIAGLLKTNSARVYQAIWRAGGRAIEKQHFWISDANLKRLRISLKRTAAAGAVASNGGFFAYVAPVQN